MNESKQILITGGTGFIGDYLCDRLMQQGHYLTLVTRSPDKYTEQSAKNKQYIAWDSDLSEAMDKTDVVINLVGENLFGQRWTPDVKKRLYDSRIELTTQLVDAMKKASQPPELFISASAVGIYGDSGDAVLTEESSRGRDFLAEICVDWETAAREAESVGVRVANPRIGIVLEDNGGVVEKMKLPFSLFVGGPLGDGKQYVPWVHMSDLCRAIEYPMHASGLSGPYNACAPSPETMNTLASAMGRVMNRPSIFRVPEFVLNIALGEAAEPILGSLRVHPVVLQKSGFEFHFTDLEEALADII
ncbi:MAG: TIGR01777 family oxidoreductase [Balneolaceae bacterium]